MKLSLLTGAPLLAVTLTLALAACSSDGGTGTPDSSAPSDTGVPSGDTGAPIAEAGADAAGGNDATVPPAADGGTDAAPPASDAGDSGNGDAGSDAGPSIQSIGHLVVLYMENHSFDNLLGTYAGAEGLASPGAQITQLQPDGTPYTTLPQTDPNVPTTLSNTPFDISKYIPENQPTYDMVHRFYQEQWQIHGGKMDQFVAISDAKGLTLGYWPTNTLPLVTFAQSIASEVTVCDHFFHAAFGGSFLNHFWLVAARTPSFPDAGAGLLVQLGADGGVAVDNQVTPDGYAINTLYTVNSPHPDGTPADQLVPEQTYATIGDELSSAGVDWAWYAGGWYQALGVDGGAPNPDPTFAFHHQPFAYFAKYADGTPGRAAHLKDETDFVAAAQAGTLPPVSFVKPLDVYSEHPSDSVVTTSENHAVDLIKAVRNSPQWKDTVLILTYDENGGQWDHVAPPTKAPQADRWGPGTRVPAIVFSPFAKGGVDSTPYDTTAILTLIEKRWKLAPLSTRDAAQADLSTHAMTFAP